MLARNPISAVGAALLFAALTGCLDVPPPAHEQAAHDRPAHAESVEAAPPERPARTPPNANEANEANENANANASEGELVVRNDRFAAPERLVALGDLHGDLAATRSALRLAGAIDEGDRWVGGKLVVVQTGDQLDRGDDEQAILELLARIQREAAAAGGAVHILNGNHEYMNALGDLRYVTEGGFADFEDAPGVDPDDPGLASVMKQVPEHARARVAAFLPGRTYARELAKRNTIVVVGDSVFVHGGVLPEYAADIRAVNDNARAFLAGDRPEPPKALTDPDGPVWSRHFSAEPDADDCALLDDSLDKLGVARMVVGHTVHTEGIQSACDGKVWMIDVGLADYYRGPTQVLEIRGDDVTVLRTRG